MLHSFYVEHILSERLSSPCQFIESTPLESSRWRMRLAGMVAKLTLNYRAFGHQTPHTPWTTSW